MLIELKNKPYLYRKGHIPWIKGKKHSDLSKEKMSKAWFKKGQSTWNKGKHWPKEWKEKMSKKRKGMFAGEKHPFWGKHLSEEHKRKIGQGNKGKVVSLESRIKMSKSRQKEKSPNWKGGISYEPYSTDWTTTLKRSIRERDNYICQICSQYGNMVHHIDYDKKNCNPDNLITLCRKCHTKTNHNRDYWLIYFNK